MEDIRILATADLSPVERDAIRRLLDEAFEGDFSDEDWRHALGGWHALVGAPNAVVAHAALVPRRLLVGTRAFHTGYVEAVAVAPDLQRTGLGSAVMTAVNALVRRHFDLGALSSGEWPFYERLGWERWRGPTWVRAADGHLMRTADDDDGVMVLRSRVTQLIDLTAPITCEERDGDSW